MNTIYPYGALKREKEALLFAELRSPTGPHRIKNMSAYSIPSPRTNDILSDSVTRIKNGYIRKLEKIALPNSKKIQEFLEALVQAGYIQN